MESKKLSKIDAEMLRREAARLASYNCAAEKARAEMGESFTKGNTKTTVSPNYLVPAETHPLQGVFYQVIRQATKGKGTRHGGDTTDFMEQPWVHYYKMHGRGFLTGQAAKKLEEAASIKNGQDFIQEALGAIAYLAMAVLKEQEELNDE